MILADTSVWVRHFRDDDPILRALLENGEICQHPFVIGELACGNLHRREDILETLSALPRATPATDAEVMLFLNKHRLFGKGIGWVDLHLLASALLSNSPLFTLDRALRTAAEKLKTAYFAPV